MSKFFKLGFGLGGSKVYIFLMNSIDGDVVEELEIESYDCKQKSFDRFYLWAGLEDTQYAEVDFSDLVIGNYRFRPSLINCTRLIDQPKRAGFSPRVHGYRESVRGEVSFVDTGIKSSLKDDLKDHFERRSFP